MKIKIFSIIFIIMMFLSPISVFADDEVSIIGESAIVRDIESGDILYKKNIDTVRYPASITKIMTALVVLENKKLNDKVEYSWEALNSIEPGSSAAYIKPGEILTVDESLYVMMLHSANDVAHGLAYAVGGNLEGFSELMNKKAVALGCTNTHFVNASGLTHEKHYTIAEDMAKIAKAAYENETLRKIMGTNRYVLSKTNKCNTERTWINGNRMIRKGSEYYYEPCLGGKTGYTVAAGGTLVTYATIEGRVMECVILKSQNSASAYEDSIKIYNYIKDNTDFSKYNEIEQLEEKKSALIEKIIYKKEKTTLEKVILAVEIMFLLIIILCILVILRILYVQYVRRKRRKIRRTRQRKNQRRKRQR